MDYGKLCREFEEGQHLKETDSWEGHFLSIVGALIQTRRGLIEVSKKTCTKGGDAPTDTMSVISIMLALRTLGILESKSRLKARSTGNNLVFRSLADSYINSLKQLIEKRNEYVALFPYE
jgi:hypothetical protein